MYWMKSSEENSNNTTKWLTPNIVHYIRDRERFRTQLRSDKVNALCDTWWMYGQDTAESSGHRKYSHTQEDGDVKVSI